jgi:hypothetical protein
MKLTYKNGFSAIEIEQENVDLNRVQAIIDQIYGSDNRIYPIPYSFIKNDNDDTLNFVMQACALYTFPTCELCEWLNSQIDDDSEYEPHSAIEICAGTGWIGRQLGIPITDLKAQEDPVMAGLMMQMVTKPVTYSDDVEKLEAQEAIAKYKPDIVIGSFVSSKKNILHNNKKKTMILKEVSPMGITIEHNLMELAEKELPFFGVDVEKVIKTCWKTILVCNLRTHRTQSYLKIPHQSLSFPWLVTRGDVSQARILVFENKLW